PPARWLARDGLAPAERGSRALSRARELGSDDRVLRDDDALGPSAHWQHDGLHDALDRHHRHPRRPVVKPDYTIHLERVFQGPMDLLLQLVREQEVEIHEIQIARILEGYMAYLETLDGLDIEYAADFLVMAATLMSIKSRSLLSADEIDLEKELD